MNDLLLKLDTSINKLSSRAFFNKQSQNEIGALEDFFSFGICNDLKAFYFNYNGGFFANKCFSDDELENIEQLELIKWNSNHFLTLAEIRKLFEFVNYFANLQGQENKSVTFLPFFQTKHQEHVVIRHSQSETYCPIFKIVYPERPEYWIKLNNSLGEFLNQYIDSEGELEY